MLLLLLMPLLLLLMPPPLLLLQLLLFLLPPLPPLLLPRTATSARTRFACPAAAAAGGAGARTPFAKAMVKHCRTRNKQLLHLLQSHIRVAFARVHETCGVPEHMSHHWCDSRTAPSNARKISMEQVRGHALELCLFAPQPQQPLHVNTLPLMRLFCSGRFQFAHICL